MEQEAPSNEKEKKRRPEGTPQARIMDEEDMKNWRIGKEWKQGDMKGSLLEESSFATLFPKFREKYIKEIWPPLKDHLMNAYGIEAELDLISGVMTIKTTRKTWDPYIIIKCRDLLRLISRGVPYTQAVKVLKDEITCDIIKIGNSIPNHERFLKRRQRLVGPDGNTLRALELLTQCYILVLGKTVAAIGSLKGVRDVRKIVEDCMKNVHPIYHIKTLMIRRELDKNPDLKNEDWNRFLPKFKKQNVKMKKKNIKKKSKDPFPPLPQKRLEDIELETGEYFLKEAERRRRRRAEKKKQSEEKTLKRQKEREKAFVPPKEKVKQETQKEVSTQQLSEQLKVKLKKKEKNNQIKKKQLALLYPKIRSKN